MRTLISAILFLALTLFWSCTQTCKVSGLQPGHYYSFMYTDSNGHIQSGTFTAPDDSSTYDLSDRL